ncbi:MAG: PEP/pyruvate-binding domain-containing protein [Acidimicrobiia bacterium]|nr:PEP/pyruvate-binding domain-containing protein [Acidimicrobiia bacterium]
MTMTTALAVVGLDSAQATDVALTGGKAAALAGAAAAGVPTLGGVVLTTVFSDEIDAGADIASSPALADAFERAEGATRSLVARSSSVVEDSATSSMAGQFASVIGIDGFDEFVAAVREVLDSRARANASEHPIGVLVQPLIEPRFGGVLFGVDPVSGRSDHLVVSAVDGGPEPLVSGEIDGSRYLLDAGVNTLEFAANDGPKLPRSVLRRLVALSVQVADVFGGPQDVEWAIGQDDQLWLLQSRPVTTLVRGVPSGPIYGPGPVAETFPEPLTELEDDLWVPPLRDGVRHALVLAGAATKAEIAESEIVVIVNGHVAIDLNLAGDAKPKPSILQRINPVPGARRLQGAWRVGRLRSALPRLAENLLDRVDADLEAVPPLGELSSRQLIALIQRGQSVLRAVHAHEILMGMLTNTGGNRLTGASVALRVLSEARQDGLSDAEILTRSPIVLALTSPKICACADLPPDALTPDLGSGTSGGTDNGVLREALRLRARWLQEATARAAFELGERLAAAGVLASVETIRHLRLNTVEALATRREVPRSELQADHVHAFGEPLPARFQLSDLGFPISARRADEFGGGTGAGGGGGSGPVTHDIDDPPPGSVLVTTTLTPGLGPLLPRLSGIIAETGSVLSHLAILARESNVATIVGYAGASDEFVDGAIVHVDGESGNVTHEEVSE